MQVKKKRLGPLLQGMKKERKRKAMTIQISKSAVIRRVRKE